MAQVAVINRSSIEDPLLALHVEAVDLQMRRDVAPAWGGSLPPPVRFYASTAGLPTGDNSAVVCTVEDAMEPGILGYHTDELGVQFLRVGARGLLESATLSHEVNEWDGDPFANGWVRIPDGLLGTWTHIAQERCDPCQGDNYRIQVTLFGRHEDIKVSDFVLPSYFNPNGKRPFTFLDTIDTPFGLSRNGGGYRLLANQRTGEVRARTAHGLIDDPGAEASLEKKLANPASRLSRRLLARAGAFREL